MKTKVTVRTIQQRMNLFHIRTDVKAGWRDEIHEGGFLFLLFGVFLSVRISKFRCGFGYQDQREGKA